MRVGIVCKLHSALLFLANRTILSSIYFYLILGQFLTAESVLKYLKDRIGLRTSLSKYPELCHGGDEYIKEEDISPHPPTLTSVELSPNLPKENVPATPMFPPNQLTKAPLSRPKVTMETLQKSTYSQSRNQTSDKSYLKFHNLDTNQQTSKHPHNLDTSQQTSKLPHNLDTNQQTSKLSPPNKLETVTSHLDLTELGGAVGGGNISIRGKVSNRFEFKKL